jgi:hypothetical protein
MSTERTIRIICDDCRVACELTDVNEMSETELRRDLTKRLGWVSYRTDVPRGHADICPACRKGGK